MSLLTHNSELENDIMADVNYCEVVGLSYMV